MVKDIGKKKFVEIATTSASEFFWLLEQETMPRMVTFRIGSGFLTIEDTSGYTFGFSRTVPAFTPNTKPTDTVEEFSLPRGHAMEVMRMCTGAVHTWLYAHGPELHLVAGDNTGATFVKGTPEAAHVTLYGSKAVGGAQIPAPVFRAAVDPIAASLVRTMECANGYLYGDGWLTAIRSKTPVDLPDFAIPGEATRALHMFDPDGKAVEVSVTFNHVKFSQASLMVYFARLRSDELLPSAVMRGLMTGKHIAVNQPEVVMAQAQSISPIATPIATVQERFALSPAVSHEINLRLGRKAQSYTLVLNEDRPLQTIVVSNELADIAAPATG